MAKTLVAAISGMTFTLLVLNRQYEKKHALPLPSIRNTIDVRGSFSDSEKQYIAYGCSYDYVSPLRPTATACECIKNKQ